MSNRVITQMGAVPLSQDILNTNVDSMIGLGAAMSALLGSGTFVDGLACTPQGGNMYAQIGPGSIYSQAAIDSTPYGVLPANSNQITQQGVLFGQTPFLFVAPSTGGFSQVFLIEAQFQQVDQNPVSLLYYNSANPTQPITGAATNTVRAGIVALQVKAGIAATTGTQVAPTADAGWVPLWLITIANGQTTIISSNITIASGAPFIQNKLGSLFTVFAGNPNGSVAGKAGIVNSNMASMVWDIVENTLWFCTSTGSTSTAVWVRGSVAQVYAGNPNGNVAGNAGSAGGISPSIIWDISHAALWVCTTTGNAAAAVWSQIGGNSGPAYCGTSTGTANAQTLSTPVGLIAFAAGAEISFLVGSGLTNTGAVTVVVGTFGTFPVVKDGIAGPVALIGKELAAGNFPVLRFDGTSLHLNPTSMGTATLQNASSNTGTVAAVTGAITSGHRAVFADTVGTLQDGGPTAAPNQNMYLTANTNIATGAFDLDSAGGSFTITTAASPTNGDNFSIKDVAGYLSANPVTWNPNGKTVNGNTGNFLFDQSRGFAFFSYKNGNWGIE